MASISCAFAAVSSLSLWLFDMAGVTLKVPRLDQCIEDIRKATADIRKGSRVTVGIHADHNPPYPTEKGKRPLTTAEVAVFNHFGTKRIPARPFLDVGIQSQQDKIIKAGKEVFSKTRSLGLAADAMGAVAVSAVQQYISRNNIPPPLSPETIKRKGSSHALIDTGQLRQSITWRRVNGK